MARLCGEHPLGLAVAGRDLGPGRRGRRRPPDLNADDDGSVVGLRDRAGRSRLVVFALTRKQLASNGLDLAYCFRSWLQLFSFTSNPHGVAVLAESWLVRYLSQSLSIRHVANPDSFLVACVL